MAGSVRFEDIKMVLLDIEGTICPIDFVKETLFPYAIEALPAVLKEKWEDSEFRQYKEAFPAEAKTSPQALEAHVKDLTQRDVKIAYLKNLQGYLWQEGYESGAYSTPLFEDVLPELEKWHNEGRKISIYSSGSIFAQKLLFAHIQDQAAQNPKAIVDRQDLVDKWFDTTNAGPKTEAESYTKIAGAIGTTASSILFFSDNIKEVKAAEQAGMKAVVVERVGNAKIAASDLQGHECIRNFGAVQL